MKNYLPTAPAMVREAIIVLAGAILAAAVIGQLPGLRDWIKTQWADAPQF